MSDSETKKNNFIVLAFILSAITVISIVSKFSFILSTQIAIFVILLITAIFLINNYKFKINSYVIPSMFFLLVGAISYVNADFQTNVRDYIFILASALLAGFNFTFLPREMKKKVFIVPIFIALWLSMIIFSKFVSNPRGFFNDYDFYTVIALNINVIAAFLVLVYPLFFIYIKEKINTNVFISMAIFVLFAIFLTRSRVAILSAFVLTIIFLFLYRKNKYVKLLIALSVLLLVSSIIYVSILKSDFGSASERLVWWKTAYLIFKENIFFGSGLGNFSVLFKAFRPERVLNTLYVHNIIMQLLSDVGIFGLLGFVSVMVCFYVKVVDKVIEGKDTFFYVAVSLSVTFFIIMNMFDYGFFVPANMLMFFMLVASVFYANPSKLKKERINSYVLAAAVFVCCVVIVRPVISQIHYKKGIEYYIANQYKTAVEEFELAIKYDKKNPEYYAQVSKSYFALYDKHRGEIGKIYADNAIKYNKKAIDLYKHGAQLRASLASIYWNIDKKEEALSAIRDALKYDKYNPYFEEYYFQIKNS